MLSPKIKKRISYFFFLFVFTLIAAEIILRIYNPFPTSVTGDKITLHNNTRRVLDNIKGPELDSRVVVSKNSLAFRGPEPPLDFNDYLTILTIGGSTTECLIVNEEKTWPALIGNELNKSFRNVWLNNAGLNGHSTYGHLKLLQDYVVKLQPKVCIFLVGCNDINRPDLSRADSTVFNKYQNLVVSLARWSRLMNVLLNFYRHHLAKERELVKGLPFTMTGHPTKIVSDSVAERLINVLKPDVVRYGERLKKMIAICRSANILPIILTQPCVLGNAIDDITGVDLATYPYKEINGKVLWSELQLYNDETKRVCGLENVLVLDLGNQLPKSTKYFYDIFHFNKAGCKKISELLSPQIIPCLKQHFPQFVSESSFNSHSFIR